MWETIIGQHKAVKSKIDCSEKRPGDTAKCFKDQTEDKDRIKNDPWSDTYK